MRVCDVAGSLEVLVAVPRALLRDAFVAALAEGDVLATGAAALDEVAACARRRDLDVAVVSLERPDHHPGWDLSLCRVVHDRAPRCRVLVISEDTTSDLARAAIEAGASGVFDQGCGLELLGRAVRAVAAGEVWLPRSVVGAVIGGHRPPPEHEDSAVPAVAALTARERDVIHLLAAGKDHRAIALELDVSPHTARTHIRNVMRKLGAHSRLEAVALARASHGSAVERSDPAAR